MRHQTQPHGLTRIELIVVLIILIIITTILLTTSFPRVRQREQARFLKDSSQIQQIGQSLLVFSRESNGAFFVPSHAVPTKEDGSEDYSLNHSANLYSLMIMRHYVTPELQISPLEVSDQVIEDEDYDYNKYQPLNGSYWDNSFVMHIEDPKIGANSSYAHIAAIGDRRNVLNSSKNPSKMPIIGTRAYDSTKLDPSAFERSITNEFYEPYDEWKGIIAFADNHVEFLDTFYPQQTTFDPGNGTVLDNIFSAEFDHPNGKQAAADAFLCISISATQYTVKDVYDPLLDD